MSSTANNRSARTRRWWSVITLLIAVAVLFEAVFAGALLSGSDWALVAHKVSAGLLIAATPIAGLASAATLRRVPAGRRLGLSLLALAAMIFLQSAVGVLTTKGANLLWVHVPFGAALFGFAPNAAARARALPVADA